MGERGTKARRKGQLPSKPCAHCGRPMEWRRKWADVWDEVRYCSKRCAGEAKRARAKERGASPLGSQEHE